MEDRYDISVDIGDGKDWWCVHGLATHDKVYGLNKQMCDIGKTILTKNKDIMEEKKTKKMTKAEAFEYLKGKKVRTCGEPRLLEKKLMECGYRWMRGVTWENDDYEDFWAYFMGYDGLITFVDIECSDYYECHNFEEISVDDILSIEIVEEMEFNYDKVVELAKPLMEYLNDVGFRDGIRVSRFGFVHEPMSTLIFDNRIGE